ncbi:MAG: hypothetical protein JSU83_19505 [Deltaproteobacteria bacterium]|nr:MAG: hypothetical protein JSU83_19505 [Deltaproteobacteria bacterium]
MEANTRGERGRQGSLVESCHSAGSPVNPGEIRFTVIYIIFTLYHLPELQGRRGKNSTPEE